MPVILTEQDPGITANDICKALNSWPDAKLVVKLSDTETRQVTETTISLTNDGVYIILDVSNPVNKAQA